MRISNIGLLIIFIGIVLFMMGIYEMAEILINRNNYQELQQNGQIAEGTVTSKFTLTTGNFISRSLFPTRSYHFLYDYEVNGQIFGGGSFSIPKKRWERVPLGGRVRVRYQPSNPDFAFLVGEEPSYTTEFIKAVVFLVGSIGILVASIFYIRWESKRMAIFAAKQSKNPYLPPK